MKAAVVAILLCALAVASVNGVSTQCLSAPKEHAVCKDSVKVLKWTYDHSKKACVKKWGCYVSSAKNVFGTQAACKAGCQL